MTTPTTYIINFSDTTSVDKPIPISISPGATDDTTGLTLLGQSVSPDKYGPAIAENFLHLLENFSSSVNPSKGVEGQLWYDTSDPNNKVLRINDGDGFIGAPEVGGIHRTSTQPQKVRLGDIWVDTEKSQVYVYNGSSFVLVGPTYSSTAQTGSYPEVIRGSDNAFYSVIKNYLNGDVLSILSQSSFRPAIVIEGFDQLVPGLNLSSKQFSSTTPIFNGVAAAASALRVSVPGSQTVSANNFFRKDIPQSLSEVLTISNNGGLNIGSSTPTVLITRESNDAVITNTSRGRRFLVKIDDEAGIRKTILEVNGSTQRIGINTLSSPAETLDVNGTMAVSGATSILGQLTVNNNSSITGDLLIGKTLEVTNTSTFNESIHRGSILPYLPNTGDIGSNTRRFNRIWANSIGTDDGTTQFYGTSNFSQRLSTPRSFAISGQAVTTATVLFDGSSNVDLSVKLNSSAIDGQSNTSTVSSSFTLAVSNPASATLFKTTKADFLNDVTPNLIKPGFIMASVGSTVNPPSGWLWCDGTSYSTAGYNALYTALMQALPAGSTPPFGDNGIGTFKVPDIPPIYASNTATTSILVRYMIKI